MPCNKRKGKRPPGRKCQDSDPFIVAFRSAWDRWWNVDGISTEAINSLARKR